MNPQFSDLVDQDKIAKTLGVNWYHEEIPSIAEETGNPEDSILENTYLFDLINTPDLKIILAIKTENSIRLYVNESLIEFNQINRILYNPKRKEILFESVSEEYFSVLTISGKGQFYLLLNQLMKEYYNSPLTVMGENLGLLNHNDSPTPTE